jgi:superfamily II DNA or RNA helicase
MASEGLDIPTLDTIIMGSPRVNIEQTIGRIVRKDNIDDYLNQPLVIDIADQVGSFKNYGYARKRIYKKMNYEIEEFDVNDLVIKARNKKIETLIDSDED